MKYNGIEYYDAIDYRGGGANTSASTYLEWMAAVRSSTPFEGDNGLHVIEYYATYNTFNGNDIWINYELSMACSDMSNYKYSCIFAQPNPDYLFRSQITNGRIFVDNTTNGEAYYMYKMNSGYGNGWDNRLYGGPNNNSTAYTGGKRYWAMYNSNINNGFYIYNSHLHDDVIDFYVNGNFYTTIYFASKYFTFFVVSKSRSRTVDNENSYIRWITLTDKMSSDIPKPPYTLGEKENNMYGILKE